MTRLAARERLARAYEPDLSGLIARTVAAWRADQNRIQPASGGAERA